MAREVMTLPELAVYLGRDARELEKLAARGKLPGRKVGGSWRFSRGEIHHWLEIQMEGLSTAQLVAVEEHVGGAARGGAVPRIADVLRPECVEVPLQARTRLSVLERLVEVAGRSWQVYDPEAVLAAVRHREELFSTALDNGVALPHPRRPMPEALGESLIAFGRTAAPIPFGAPGGGLTDLFFLLCARDDRTHLRLLARLTRMLQAHSFLEELRAAQGPSEAHRLILAAEEALADGSA